MEKEFVLSLSQSYRQDVLDAIQLAEQGMLSPSQQAYCFEEIEETKGTVLYPADGDELFCQLRTVLGEKTQTRRSGSSCAPTRRSSGAYCWRR